MRVKLRSVNAHKTHLSIDRYPTGAAHACAVDHNGIERALPELPADYRVTCNEEVNQGLSAEAAVLEARRVTS